jgi:hypothetical protein
MIVSGLLSPAVQKLKKTWETVSSKDMNNLESMEKLLDPSGNMRTYRRAYSSASPPSIPFFPVVMKDVTFLNDGNAGTRESIPAPSLKSRTSSRISLSSSTVKPSSSPFSNDAEMTPTPGQPGLPPLVSTVTPTPLQLNPSSPVNNNPNDADSLSLPSSSSEVPLSGDSSISINTFNSNVTNNTSSAGSSNASNVISNQNSGSNNNNSNNNIISTPSTTVSTVGTSSSNPPQPIMLINFDKYQSMTRLLNRYTANAVEPYEFSASLLPLLRGFPMYKPHPISLVMVSSLSPTLTSSSSSEGRVSSDAMEIIAGLVESRLVVAAGDVYKNISFEWAVGLED